MEMFLWENVGRDFDDGKTKLEGEMVGMVSWERRY
jgi:hypothetical protein